MQTIKEPKKHFSGTLAKLISDRGLTLRDLADRIGVHPATLVRIRQDMYRCDRELLEKLSLAFKGNDYAKLVLAHVTDEVGQSGLKLISKKGSLTPALMPQTSKAFALLNGLPDNQRDAAERAVLSVIQLFTSSR